MKNKIRGIRDGLDAWRTQPDEIFFFSFLFSLLVEKNCNTSYIRVYVCVCVFFFFFNVDISSYLFLRFCII